MKKWLIHLLIFIPIFALAQIEENNDKETQVITDELVVVGNEKFDTINYLNTKSPIRASLYSAILPGMGQVYNKKYWKVPIVWGLLGTGVGFVLNYDKQYKEFRGYYLDKLYGNEIENPTINNMSARQLATIQDDRKRTRDYAIALTALVYILNILDATVDAHLYGMDKDPDLSLKPTMIQNPTNMQFAMGFGVSYKF
mgnify:FL=1